MPGSSGSRRNPAWLRRRVLLRAWRLEAVNRLRGKGSSWQLATALLGAAGVLAWLVTYWGPSIVSLAGRHLFSTGIVLALQSALLTNHGRKKWTEYYSQSWLATLPLDRQDCKTLVALRACWPPIAVLIGFTVVLLAAVLFARVTGGTVFPVATSCAVGTCSGILIGWWLPQRDPAIPLPASSLVHGRPGAMPALAAMSGWPLLQTRVWLRPRSIARLMLVALGLPMDVSGNVAVAILWTFIVGLYLVVLLRATIEVAGQGASWLRPTPLSFARFAWAVLRYPILKQLLWTTLTAGMLAALGMKPFEALSLAELWLAIFTAVSSIALAHAYGSTGMRLKILVSICCLAAIETVKHHIALPCALVFSGWQLNRAARS
jgi:hypothetical protein